MVFPYYLLLSISVSNGTLHKFYLVIAKKYSHATVLIPQDGKSLPHPYLLMLLVLNNSCNTLQSIEVILITRNKY